MSVVYDCQITARGPQEQLEQLECDLRDSVLYGRLMGVAETDAKQKEFYANRLRLWCDRFAGGKLTFSKSEPGLREFCYFWDREDFYDPAVLLLRFYPDVEFTLVDTDEMQIRSITSVAKSGTWIPAR